MHVRAGCNMSLSIAYGVDRQEPGSSCVFARCSAAGDDSGSDCFAPVHSCGLLFTADISAAGQMHLRNRMDTHGDNDYLGNWPRGQGPSSGRDSA